MARRRRSKGLSGFIKALIECIEAMIQLARLLVECSIRLLAAFDSTVEQLSKEGGKQQRGSQPRTARRSNTSSDWRRAIGVVGEPDTSAVLEAISRPARLWSRSEVLTSGRCPVPEARGLYGWYFRRLPDRRILADRCVCHAGCYLLYVGIAPKSERSKTNLRSRIKDHYRSWTTLRQTLGSLLAQELGLRPRNKKLQWDREDILSDWMARNAVVVWVEHPAPWVVEREIIRTLDLPLNLNHNTGHPFYAKVKAARKRQRDIAH